MLVVGDGIVERMVGSFIVREWTCHKDHPQGGLKTRFRSPEQTPNDSINVNTEENISVERILLCTSSF